MAKIQTIHSFVCDVQQGALEVNLQKGIMHQDAMADVFRVEVMQGGQRVDLAGVSVHGYLYVAQTRQTVPLAGSVEGNAASVVLTSACYAAPGYASLCVQLHAADVRHTLLKANFCIGRTGSDQIIDPEGVLPSLPDLLAEIDNMRAATATAEAAADFANQAASVTINATLHLMGAAAPVIIQSASGDGIVAVSDSAERSLSGMSVYGKTTQDGTPTPEAPVPLMNTGDSGSITVSVRGKNLLNMPYRTGTHNGATYEVDGSRLKLYGTLTGVLGIEFLSSNHVILNEGKYTISSDNFKLLDRIEIRLQSKDGTVQGISTVISGTNRSVTITAQQGDSLVLTFVGTKDTAFGTADAPTIINLMLERGTSATDHEPFKDGGSMTASTPNGLLGIPVSSGGKYIDSTGQQWVCDEIDLTRKVYVQRIGAVELNGTNYQAYAYENYPGVYRVDITASGYRMAYGVNKALCSHYAYDGVATAPSEVPKDNTFRMYRNYDPGVTTCSVYFKNTKLATLDDFKAALSASPVSVAFPIRAVIETPLSPEELTGSTSLTAKYPNTTAFNDAGAGLKMDYIADTKNYIDQRIAALLNA